MAETKILNLASFEDVETLKQTTKSQGEEISQVKQDLGSQNTIFNGALFDYKYNLLAGRIWVHGSWASSKPTDVKNRIRTGIINIDGLPNTFFCKSC